MVELGEKQDEYNEAFGAQAAKVCDHIILVGRRQAPPIEKGVLCAGFPKEKLTIVDTIQEAFS